MTINTASSTRFAVAGLLAILSVADLVITRQILLRGGIEVNPLMNLIIGEHSATVAKGLAVPVAAFAVAWFLPRARPMFTYGFVGVAMAYATVVYLGLIQLAFVA